MQVIATSTNNSDSRSVALSHILILECELLLGAGLKSLLAEKSTLKINGITADNQVELLEQIGQLQPDVIVVDALSTLTDPFQLLAALNAYPKFLRVVEVSANDNRVCIYDRRQILLTQSSDLTKLLLDY